MQPPYSDLRLFLSLQDSKPGNPEKGSIVIMVALVLVVLLGLVGLAIDGGNLYRAQIALQNAADATSLATVNYITMKGKLNFLRQSGVNAEGADPDVEATAVNLYLNSNKIPHNLVRANMALAGFPNTTANPIQLLPDPSPQNYEVQAASGATVVYSYKITATRPVDFFLMYALPGSGGMTFSNIRAHSQSQRKPLNVAIVLDISDSMHCPPSGVCDCMVPKEDGSRPSCPAHQRIDELIAALNDLLRMLDIDRDNITVVPFNLSAKALSISELKILAGYQDTDVATGEMIDDITEKFKTSFPALSDTNFCDALIEAYISMMGIHKAPNSTDNVSYVFFTDGAPTAGRFLFTSESAKSRLNINQVSYSWYGGNNYYPGDYDYMSYTIEWLDADYSYAAGPSLLVPSPYLCAQPNMCRVGNVINPPGGMPEQPTLGTVGHNCDYSGTDCDLDGAGPGLIMEAPPVLINKGVIPSTTNIFDVAVDVFDPCLSKLEAHMPNDPAAPGGVSGIYGAQYANPIAGSLRGLESWREQYYNCAIQLADFIRAQRGIFYLVGLGDPLSPPPPADDPYEDIEDNFHRKDIFLNRLAYDPISRNMSAPEFSYDGYMTYADIAARKDPEGLYLPTHNAADIRIMFVEIARKLLLKMVS